MTFRIMTFSIMTFSITTFRITTFRITTFRITTFRITTFSITTLRITTLSIMMPRNYNNNIFPIGNIMLMLIVVKLSVAIKPVIFIVIMLSFFCLF
jgi:hypothetical protein